MGSASAEVSSSTTDILLESAHFEPRGILRTSRRLLLPTEAAIRFSRGADPEGVAPAADRAARLMVAWSGGGTVLRGAVDVGTVPARRSVRVRPARASLLIGHGVSAGDVVQALGRIGVPSEERGDAVEAEIPGSRPDLEREVDLIEEVARVQGYENLRSTLPGIRQAGGLAPTYAFRRRLRELLVRAGAREALSLSFASLADLELMGWTDGVPVANPPSADQPLLRRSLVPNLLQALVRTLARGARGVVLFEIGHVFHPGDPVDERELVAMVLTGPAEPSPFGDAHVRDLFDAKGALEVLLGGLGIADVALRPLEGPTLHPGRSATVMVGDARAGILGELHPRAAERLGLPQRVALFELDVAVLSAHAARTTAYREIPRFPPVRRDLAFTLDAATPAGQVRAAIVGSGGELLGSAILFDVHEGDPLPAGKKSLAFSLELRAPDRTLTDAEAAGVVERIAARLREAFGAELRSG
jgi:phenylalanyl-tRNA synthetase beta chain